MTEAAPTDPHDVIRRPDRAGMWIGPIVILALLAWMSHWALNPDPNPELSALWVLGTSLPWALVWIGGAIGLGWPLRCCLAPRCLAPLALQCPLGIAIMLFIDSAMGTTGLLQAGGTTVAFSPLLLGLLLLAEQIRRWMKTRPEAHSTS